MTGEKPQETSRWRAPTVVWPAFLIGLGVLFLGDNLGWLPGDFWQNIWRFWPVVLILLGIEVLVRRSGGERTGRSVSGAIVLGIVLFVAWAFMSAAGSGVAWSERGPVNAWGTSGTVVTQEKDFAGFNRVEVSGPFKVEIVQSDVFSTAISANSNIANRVVAARDGDTLRISVEGSVFAWDRPDLEARIALPVLRSVRLSEAANGTITGFKSNDDLTLEGSGASSLNGQIESGNTRIKVSGASKVNLAGTGADADLTASGASNIRLDGFQVRNANVKAEGASQVVVNVTGRLDAHASGVSKIHYVGSPTLGAVDIDPVSAISRR